MVRRRLTVIGLLAALSYNNWLLGPILNPNLWRHNGSVSEYSVTNQPAHLIFRFLDIIAGLLLIYLGYRLFLLIKERPFGRPAAILLAFLGLSNIFVAMLVLPWSQTLSARCQVPLSFSIHNFHMPLHAYSSSLIGVCYFLVPLLVLIYSFKAKLSRLAVFSTIILLDSLYALVSALVEYQRNGGPTTKTSGAGQEVEMIMLGIWLVMCAYELVTNRSKMVPDMGH
jgi:hypothetical protein